MQTNQTTMTFTCNICAATASATNGMPEGWKAAQIKDPHSLAPVMRKLHFCPTCIAATDQTTLLKYKALFI